jgi:protease-4
VFAGKISLAGLYEKIGINKETAVRGEHADMYSDTRSFTEQEREIVQRQMSMFYDHFLKIVAEGRRRTPAAVDSVAQGRVWSGADARANGLVDAFGGLPHAISSAAAMAGIGNRRYEVSILPRASRTLSGWLGSPLWRLLSGEDDPISELSSLADEHIWYLLPWRLDLR